MRRSIFIGNWKMNHTVGSAIRLVTELRTKLSGKLEMDIVIAPPFTLLHPLEIAVLDSPIELGAQNVHWEDRGAFTGEVSSAMLADVSCKYCIVGHSERRTLFNESDQFVNKKILNLLDHGIKPVLCVGETQSERKNGQTTEVLQRQLQLGLRSVNALQSTELVIAYEPVWAIGTQTPASPAMAQEAHVYIREQLGNIFRKDVAQDIRIVYGGSVNPSNIAGFMDQKDIDGALIGGASLESDSFLKIVFSGSE